MAGHSHTKNSHHKSSRNPYVRLAMMLLVSFVAMYGLMYAMVNVLGNVLPNVNQLYMAGLMTGAMGLIEIAVMWHMYPKKAINITVIIISVAVLFACWFGIRLQWGVNDQEFLRSMIPHHGGAVLMCEQAAIRDTDIQQLCAGIIEGQQAEIDWMKQKLESL